MPKIKFIANAGLSILVFGFFGIAHSQQQVGDSLMQIGDYRNAIITFKALDQDPVVFRKIAQAYNSLGQSSEAIAAYQEIVKLEPSAVQARFELAKLYLSNNQLIEAGVLFQDLVKEYPNNPSFLFYKGQSLEELGSDPEAIKIFKEVLELDPDYRRARIALVPILIKTRQTQDAITYSKEHLVTQPNDIKFNSLIAQAYFHSRIYNKAIEHLERLFDLGNDTDFNRKTLALSYFNNADWKKAVENIDIYLEQYDDKVADLYFFKSQALLRLQEYESALKAIDAAIQYKRPSIAQEYLQMASIKAAQNDAKGTFETMLLAQKENTESEVVAYQLVLAADRYFEDKETTLKYYERFLKKFGSESSYGEYASSRANDLKKLIFMEGEN